MAFKLKAPECAEAGARAGARSALGREDLEFAAERGNWQLVELIGRTGEPALQRQAAGLAVDAGEWQAAQNMAILSRVPETGGFVISAAGEAKRFGDVLAIAEGSEFTHRFWRQAKAVFAKAKPADVSALASSIKRDELSRDAVAALARFAPFEASKRATELLAQAGEWGALREVCAHSPSALNARFAIDTCAEAREFGPVRYAAEISNDLRVEGYAMKKFSLASPLDAEEAARHFDWLTAAAIAKWGGKEASERAIGVLFEARSWSALGSILTGTDDERVLAGLREAFSKATVEDVCRMVALKDWAAAAFMATSGKREVAVRAAVALEESGQRAYGDIIYRNRSDGAEVRAAAISALNERRGEEGESDGSA
jgi:hypothetical protein